MRIEPTKIEGVYVLASERFEDDRGHFYRAFCKSEIKEKTTLKFDTAQANISVTKKAGSVRGMHLQRQPFAEDKIVRVLNGRIFDVVVDMRRQSATFLQHVKIELNADDSKALLIPKGCAHGFQTLSDDCHLLYFHSENYSSDHEMGFLYNDPVLNIQWPLICTRISDKDMSYPPLSLDFKGIEI